MPLSTETTDIRQYFHWMAEATKDVLGHCGGVVVLSREELISEAEVVDVRLRSLPNAVRQHPTLGFKSKGIGVTPCAGLNSDFLLFWDSAMYRDEQEAREALERHGLSEPDAHIAMLDAAPRRVVLATI